MQPGDANARGIILSEEESRNCTIEKHEELLKNDVQAGRETKKVGLSIHDFAVNYQIQAKAQGMELSYREAEKMSKDFIDSQVQATNRSAFHANKKSFLIPALPWKLTLEKK